MNAICIDHDELVEKKQQVLIMDPIYALAESVLLWLGKERVSDQSAIIYVQRPTLSSWTLKQDTCMEWSSV